jgi:hypothetical protein
LHDALQTQAWFGKQGPAWAQPLPLVHYAEQEKILCSSDLPRHLVVYYANSLQRLAFKYLEHPLFFDYARGVMCHPDGPTYLPGDPQLLASAPCRHGLTAYFLGQSVFRGTSRCTLPM